MQKALGIAALIVAIVSIFIPVFGPYITIISAILAAFSYGAGFTFGLSAIIINIINVFFLSPTVWIVMAANAVAEAQGRSLLSVGIILFSAQAIAAVILFILHKKTKSRLQLPNS